MLQKDPDVQQSDSKVNSLRVKLQSADTELEKHSCSIRPHFRISVKADGQRLNITGPVSICFVVLMMVSTFMKLTAKLVCWSFTEKGWLIMFLHPSGYSSIAKGKLKVICSCFNC